MLLVIQTKNGIQHVEHNICGIAHVPTYRKDDIFMQRQRLLSFAHPPQKKESNTSKKYAIPELHTAPALSRLCSIFLAKAAVGLANVKVNVMC